MRGTLIPIGLTLLLGVVAACKPSPTPMTGPAAAQAASQRPAERAATESAITVSDLEIEPPAETPEVESGPEYVIQDGDVLAVKFFFNPELNEEVTVRPDGRISLQLVPEMLAAGRTPSDLTRSLETLYARELDSPEISVIVRSFSAQRVYVDGEVNRGGELDLVNGLTVLGAIASAQGMTDRAYKEQVVLIRRGEDGRPMASELNVEQMRKGRAPDPLLMPYDVVFVPMTKISIWNRWVDQYIRNSIPVSFGFRIDVVD
ncbi:MAG: polysaccharide biosynthesis/export family protein [Thermoanaerobaculia bacterium]